MKPGASKQFIFVFVTVIAAGSVSAADYEPAKLTVPASTIVPAEWLKGDNYSVDDSVTINGYMNHYNLQSHFGPFTAVGDRALNKLIGEIHAIAQLKQMTSLSVGTDAAVDAVANTGKSVAALIKDPRGTAENLSAGVSRLFKRTSKAAKDVSEEVKQEVKDEQSAQSNDEPSTSTKLASAYLGIGGAQRKIAKELDVDPYSSNQVLQEELKRVAEISGTVGKLTKVLIPVPSVVGTAASVSDMVWRLSPTDLLIQNKEKLRALGFGQELIDRFFDSDIYSPTEQSFMVAAIESLARAEGRETLLRSALRAETAIEADYILRAAQFYAGYNKKIEGITRLVSANRIPVVITKSGDGLIFAALDRLLWSEEVAEAVQTITKKMDDNGVSGSRLLWTEGQMSKLAVSRLNQLGWKPKPRGFDRLKQGS